MICPRCHGEGSITFNPAWPDPQGEQGGRCDSCGGTGTVFDLDAFACSGIDEAAYADLVDDATD